MFGTEENLEADWTAMCLIHFNTFKQTNSISSPL